MNFDPTDSRVEALPHRERPDNLEQFERLLGLALWAALLVTLFFLGAQ